MKRGTNVRLLAGFLAWSMGCAVVLQSSPLHAADEETYAAARECVELENEWPDTYGGYERAEAYRAAARCFKALYVRVLDVAGYFEYDLEEGLIDDPSEDIKAVEEEFAKWLDELESAYFSTRSVCLHIRFEGLVGDIACGTDSTAPHEFLGLLKNMIADEDTGWYQPDTELAEALGL